MRDERARPQLTRLASERNDRTATLVSGWIESARLGRLIERLAGALDEGVTPEDLARLTAAVEALAEDDEDGLEWRLPFRPPLVAHFVPAGPLLAVDVLLEGAREASVEAVHGAFADSTVDPPEG